MSKINYPRYRGIPHVAGIGTMEEAMNPGLSVEEVVLRLKRHHYAMKRLHGIMTSRITSEPIYELKTAFSLHSYLCADHVAGIRDEDWGDAGTSIGFGYCSRSQS